METSFLELIKEEEAIVQKINAIESSMPCNTTSIMNNAQSNIYCQQHYELVRNNFISDLKKLEGDLIIARSNISAYIAKRSEERKQLG